MVFPLVRLFLSRLGHAVKKTLPGSSTVDLSDLISDRARDVLAGGGGGHSDRSYAIVSLAREAFGWENWARENSIPLSGQSAEALTLSGAENS
jgi:hypothetical protein